MLNNKIKKILSICILSVIYFLISSSAYALEVSRKTLPNGLVVLQSEKHNLPIVMLTLLVKGGQINEPEEKAGLAYLTAELLTEGTKHRNALEVSEEIEFIGASLGASAERDYTTISLSVLKKDIHKGFELFSDILLNPTFPQDEIERKRELIKGFLKQQEEDPSFLARRAFIKEVFGEHPYGRLIEGYLTTINTITREDVSHFHSEFFLPNNSILSVVGDLTTEELAKLIEQYLSGWKRADLQPGTVDRVHEQRNKKLVKIDKDLKQANILLGNLGISRDNPDYYAVFVMNYILGGGGFTSRLMQTVRDEMGLAYDIHSFFEAYRQGGMFQVGSQTKNESANTVIEEVFRQIERIRKEEVTDEELSDAQAYLTGSFPRRLDTNRKIADFLSLVEFYDLGLDYAEKYPQYINAVTKEDVLRVAKKYLDPENYVLVVVADQKKAHIQENRSQ
jgi:zinc protease